MAAQNIISQTVHFVSLCLSKILFHKLRILFLCECPKYYFINYAFYFFVHVRVWDLTQKNTSFVEIRQNLPELWLLKILFCQNIRELWLFKILFHKLRILFLCACPKYYFTNYAFYFFVHVQNIISQTTPFISLCMLESGI